MSYFQLNDIKRDRIPYYTNEWWNRPAWAPEVSNTPILNLKKAGYSAIMASCLVEPVMHYWNSIKTINLVYEAPKDTAQLSIYIKEGFKTPFFFSELRKKLVYGAIQHTLDAGFKVSCFHYIFGGTWSPRIFSDTNSVKYILCSFYAALLSCWTQYPLDVARKTYYADIQWPEELRKGYRSPLHALLKIPFTEGPLYLFRGGLPVCAGNFFGMGWMFFIYSWIKDKAFFLWKQNDLSYSWCKFWILNFSFLIGSTGSQPFFYIKNLFDNAPKCRGGKPLFNSSFEALKYVKLKWHDSAPTFQQGYWTWFKNHGLILYLTVWFADNYGLMDNFREDPFTWRVASANYID
jgi:hypothetical protein